MPSPLAQHTVQPEADEKRHERQDDDDSQIVASGSSFSNEHNARSGQIQSPLQRLLAIAPHFTDC
jgi:UDP-N-acetylenolpyruvoylglucosamine reductase